MVTKDLIKAKIEERKQSRVHTRIARGQNVIGALRTKHPPPVALKEALEAILAEVRLPQPSESALDSLRLEMYSALDEKLRSFAETQKQTESAAALEEMRQKNDESIEDLAEKVLKDLEQNTAELNQRIKEIEDLSNVDKTTSDADHNSMSSITREELDAKLETIETRMDGRLRSIDEKLDTKFAQFESNIHKGTSETIKWVVGTAIAMGAIGITTMTFILNNAIPKAPAAQPAPIVINVPQPAVVPQTPPK